jgi:cell division septum initiation protein DivIVA
MSLEAHHRFILDTLQRNQDIAQNIINKLEAENASLKAEVERLTKAGDTLVAAYCMGDRNKERWAEYPVVREWLAAKGELP